MDIRELHHLWQAGEGPHTEFKREFPEKPHSIAIGMVAIANSGGGVLLLGLEDVKQGGRLLGIAHPEDAVERLAGIARSTSPRMRPEIAAVALPAGRAVVYARIAPAGDCLYMYQGKVYSRVGSTNCEVSGGEELRALLEDQSNRPRVSTAQSSAVFDPPPVRAFKGRDSESAIFDGYMSASSARVLAIEGISGIGKTALAARFAETARARGYSVFWHECREDTSVDAFGSALRYFAQSLGNAALTSALEDVGLAPDERALRVAVGLAEQKCVVILDDYHLVVDRLLERLLSRIAERAVTARIVVTSRKRPSLVTALSPVLSIELPLRVGLEPEAMMTFLAECGLSLHASHRDKVWRLTGEGHPKALEILAVRARTFPIEDLLARLPVFREDLRVNWLQPLIDELPSEQRECALDLAVFDRAIPEAAIAQLYPSREMQSSVAALVDRFLLDRMLGQRLNMHMLVREVCYDEIADKAAKHRWAAGYYSQIRSEGAHGELWTDAAVEAGSAVWQHLLKAGDLESAKEELTRLRPQLMRRGDYERVMFLLEQTPASEVDLPWRALDKARILSIWGDSEGALALLSPLLTSGDAAVQREAVLVAATVHTDRNHPELAQRLLDGMHSLFIENAPVVVRRRFLTRLVEVQLQLGDPRKALEWANKLCQLCEVEGDEIGGALALRQMAGVLQREGELSAARSLAETSHDLLTRHARMREGALSETLLATVCRDLGDMPAARRHAESALATFAGIGDRRNAALCGEQLDTILRSSGARLNPSDGRRAH